MKTNFNLNSQQKDLKKHNNDLDLKKKFLNCFNTFKYQFIARQEESINNN